MMKARGYWDWFTFKRNGKWGFRGYGRSSQRLVIQPRFDAVDSFWEGFAAVAVAGKWGYIDESGKFIVKPRFSWANSFHEEMAAVRLGGGYVRLRMQRGKLQVLKTTEPARSFMGPHFHGCIDWFPLGFVNK